ncbi:MAG: hypothetical protein WCF84_27220 [Anaerolineae bacterium]
MSEGKLFNCPSCGASLSLDNIGNQTRCPYCGNAVVVPPELRPTEHTYTPAPINIVLNDGATSIQLGDLPASPPNPINLTLNEPALMGAINPLSSPQAGRWIKIGIWVFVGFIVLTVVIPLLCSVCGIVAGIGGAFLPSFIK